MAVSIGRTLPSERGDDVIFQSRYSAGTLLTVTYVVGGYTADGLEALAGPVDGVIVEQFERLKAHTRK